MLNVIKMDLYRMFKSKSTWIILMLAPIVVVIFMFSIHYQHEFYLNNPEALTISEQFTEEEAEEMRIEYAENPMYSTEKKFDIYNFFPELVHNSIIGLFVAIFIVIFADSERSTGFIKNIAGQPSIRYRTILSKCFSVFVFIIMVIFLDFAVTVICSKLLFGYIGFGLYSIFDTAAFMLTQLLLNCVLGFIVLCITELFRNIAVSITAGILVSMGILKLITNLFDNLIRFENFSFTSLIITSYISTLPLPFNSGAYHRAWIVSAVFTVIAAAISIFSMTKRDIR